MGVSEAGGARDWERCTTYGDASHGTEHESDRSDCGDVGEAVWVV